MTYPLPKDLEHSKIVWLYTVSITLLVIYGATFLIVLDTMRLHDIFKLKLKSLNLYLFYFLAIVVVVGRYMSIITIITTLLKDNQNIYYYYYNYGFYTAAFAIILIAISQINSINSATLKTIFVNEHQKGKDPSIKRLSCILFAINIATCVIDLSFIAYWISIVYRLHKYVKENDNHTNTSITALNK